MSSLRAAKFGLLFLTLLGVGAASAQSARCPGKDGWVFEDVDGSDPFCSHITWMAQNNITLGCSVIDGTRRLYCGNEAVGRVQMAAFMKRLNDALFPLDCGIGQSLRWNGTVWDCAADPPGVPGPQGPQGAQGPIGPAGPAGPTGNEGPAGPTGPPGVAGQQGQTGPAGPAGAPGVDGRTILSGNVDPVDAQGINGDYYLNAQTTTLFGPKTGGTWNLVAGVSLIGAQGSTGAIGPIGPTGPQGPVGPQGAEGPVGPQGTQGPVGPGTVTSVTAGTGLSGGTITGTGTLAVDTTSIQARVTGNCPANSSIRAIAADGTVTCEADDTGTVDAFVRGGNAFGARAVLGTRDDYELEIRVNQGTVMRYVPNEISPNIIGGSWANNVTVGVRGATIAGGGTSGAPNRVTDEYGTVGGGYANRAGDAAGDTLDSAFATVSGGRENTAAGAFNTVGGGLGNTAAGGSTSTVSGGARNTASGFNSTIGGGTLNTASGSNSTIGGGVQNTASGVYSTVGGGVGNTASGNYSWAGGKQAWSQSAGPAPVFHSGAFVWADSSSGADFNSTADNEFAVRAAGGVRFVTATAVGGSPTRSARFNPNAELEFGSQTRQMLNLWGPSTYGIGVQSNTMYFRVESQPGGTTTGGWSWYEGGTHNDATNNPGGGVELMRLAINGDLTTAGTVNGASDVHAKRAFATVDPQQILARVAAMPITTWEYRADHAGTRHIGPTAQDFAAAFGVGTDDKHIAMVDADGVALAAIQGLNAKLEAKVAAKDAEIAALKREMADHRATHQKELADLRLAVEVLMARTTSQGRVAQTR